MLPCRVQELQECVDGVGCPDSSAFILVNGRPLSGLPPSLVIHPHDHVVIHHGLLGGKGGFGALLRGLGRDPSKLVDNYDACRDISGRRLRHVTAETKLRDWKRREAEREEAKRQAAEAKKRMREEEEEQEREEIEAVLQQTNAVADKAKEQLSIVPRAPATAATKPPSKRRKVPYQGLALPDNESDSDSSDSEAEGAPPEREEAIKLEHKGGASSSLGKTG